MSRELICPYCSAIQQDAWEYFSSAGTNKRAIQCYVCRKYFAGLAKLIEDYSTYGLPCCNGEADHDWSGWLPSVIENSEIRSCLCCYKREYREVSSDE